MPVYNLSKCMGIPAQPINYKAMTLQRISGVGTNDQEPGSFHVYDGPAWGKLATPELFGSKQAAMNWVDAQQA